MSNTPPTPSRDLATEALTRVVAVLAEDAIFGLAAAAGDPVGALDGLGKRRADVYAAAVQGTASPGMLDRYDAWFVQLARAMAPVSPPPWIPMMDVVREKVSLEIGARGLRSLFSSKPSEKDATRVKRFGALAVRTLRAVSAADGPIDAEEALHASAVIASLGLPEGDAQLLQAEKTVAPEQLDIYSDIEPGVARAVIRGAWLAAAQDMIDPREEQVIKVVAHKTGVVVEDVEAARAEALARVEARRLAGLATVDGIRYVLSDRVPGPGVRLPAVVGQLVIPRRYRDEALAAIGHGAPVTLARRYAGLPSEDRTSVLAVTWAAALTEDPTLARHALLRSRWERLAEDLGEDSSRARTLVDDWMGEVLAPLARNMR
jgi:tellurite resistance protein